MTYCAYCKENIPIAMPFCSSACRDWQEERHKGIAEDMGHTRKKGVQITRVYYKAKFPKLPFPRKYTFVNDWEGTHGGGDRITEVDQVYDKILEKAGMTRYKPQEMSSREAHRLLASDEYKAKYK